MINGKRIVVVMPAYNASKTLENTVRELPDIVDATILVDDKSTDRTVEIAENLGLQIFVHDKNYGYGRNQQTCYREALSAGASIVVMVGYGSSRLPVHTTAGDLNGRHDCFRCLRRCARLSNPWRRGFEGRYARL